MNVINMKGQKGRFRHLSQLDFWLRLSCVALSLCLLSMLKHMVWLFAAVQVASLLFTGKPWAWLTNWSQMYSAYLYQLIDYVVFATDSRPYPFYGLTAKNVREHFSAS